MTALAEVTILAIVVFDIALAPQNGVVLVVVHETMPHEEGGAKATPATHKNKDPQTRAHPHQRVESTRVSLSDRGLPLQRAKCKKFDTFFLNCGVDVVTSQECIHWRQRVRLCTL